MSISAYFLVGPTASGKSRIAHQLAETLGYAILSADSMAVYRGMDIGTAKPSLEERKLVQYGGIDLVDPAETFSAWAFREEALRFIGDSNTPVIVVGGTGLYVKSLTHGLSEGQGASSVLRKEWESRVQAQGVGALVQEVRRVAPEVDCEGMSVRRLIRVLERAGSGGRPLPESWQALSAGKMQPLAGIRIPTVLLNKRIAQRVESMYDSGLLDEYGSLVGRYGTLSSTAAQAIGYAEAARVVSGEWDRETAIERTVIRTRQLAKRQRTWFRTQATVQWFDCEGEHDVGTVAAAIREYWEHHGPTAIIDDDASIEQCC